MKRLLFFLMAIVVLATPVVVMAQGPGEGGIIIEASPRSSADIRTFNPVQCSGVDCSNPLNLMYPFLLGVDPDSQNVEIGTPGTLITDIAISDDGLQYTATLRDDMVWNDGESVSIEDAYFTWQAILQGETVGLTGSLGPLTRDVESVDFDFDNNTITFNFPSNNCQALERISIFPIIPAHAYGFDRAAEADFDWASLVDHAEALNPSVTAGPFQFDRMDPGTAIYLKANQSYADPTNGEGVMPEGYVFLDILDENILLERFLAGGENNPNYVREPNTFAPLLAAGPDEAQVLSAPGRVWHYFSMNVADPNNPQNGLDDDGNPVEQGLHPIFGDKLVRQALQYAVDIDAIVNGPLDGSATAMVAGTIPNAFTIHPELERRPYDLDQARAMLDEAGWVAEGDPLVDGGDGLRVCRGCATAADGDEFFFVLMNPGGIRNDVSVLMQDMFAQIGVDVEVTPLDFNAMYDDNLGAQTYDAAIAGWRGSLPFDPDQRSFFGAQQDIFGEGYGFNFGSWYNAEFEAISEQINTVEGCDVETRKEMAYRVQEIMWDEQPYLWLYALNSVYAASPNIENFDPKPNFGQWNADAWNVAQ